MRRKPAVGGPFSLGIEPSDAENQFHDWVSNMHAARLNIRPWSYTTVAYSTFFQVLSGSNDIIAVAVLAVFLPRFFS